MGSAALNTIVNILNASSLLITSECTQLRWLLRALSHAALIRASMIPIPHMIV